MLEVRLALDGRDVGVELLALGFRRGRQAWRRRRSRAGPWCGCPCRRSGRRRSPRTCSMTGSSSPARRRNSPGCRDAPARGRARDRSENLPAAGPRRAGSRRGGSGGCPRHRRPSESPIAPSRISSRTRLKFGIACRCMPTCVASLSFFFSQFARTTRASSTLMASGFSQYTCRSRFKAQLAMKACVWSAVQMTTASRSFCSRHFRQST